VDADRDAREWRALAVAGAGAIALLTVRVWRGRALAATSWEFARSYFSGKLPLVDEDELDETWDQMILRRLGACEAHLPDLEERLNDMGIRMAELERLTLPKVEPGRRNAKGGDHA
jgi:hypothetical protein